MDLKNVGVSSIANKIVKNNILGISEKMEKKGWVDSQGQKGKVGSL